MVWLSSTSLTCSLARTQSGLLGHQVKVFICISRSRASEGASRYCAPNLWNKLSADLRSITLCTLKTNAEPTTSSRSGWLLYLFISFLWSHLIFVLFILHVLMILPDFNCHWQLEYMFGSLKMPLKISTRVVPLLHAEIASFSPVNSSVNPLGLNLKRPDF